jgi:UDP-N-acetylmuramate--alanine ligase
MPGEHNLRNAETAIALSRIAGVSLEIAVAALETFPGVERRLEKIGSLGSATAVSDYAHHPDEVRAALQGVSSISEGVTGVVFQPHLYSRTASLAEEFGKALACADWSIVLPIYPAREEPIPGITSSLIVDAAIRDGGVCAQCSPDDLKRVLKSREAEYIVFMGAGSVDELARELVDGGSG